MEHGRALHRRRASLLALLGVSLLGLAACEGDNGPGGAQGPGGPAGPTGPTGPTSGAPPVAITSSSLRSIVPDVTNVFVPQDTGRPVVSFFVVDEQGRPLVGLAPGNVSFALARLATNATGGREWQSITQRTETPGAGSWPGTSPVQQGTTEPGTAGTLVDHGDGTYTYTFATDLRAVPGVDYDASLVHRLGLEIRNYPAATSLLAANAPYTFTPATGVELGQSGREIVDDATCERCHDKLQFHGGVRTDPQYCVVCHNPSSTDAQSGNSVDLGVMIHKIHYGHLLPSVQSGTPYVIYGFGNSANDYSKVEFPADVRECGTCHDEGNADTPQAQNWRTQPSMHGCGSCHDDIDFATGANHAGIVATDAECSMCHGPDSGFGLRADDVHFVPERRAAAQFAYELLDVTATAPGESPSVRFRITNPEDGTAWDIAADAPFTQCAGGASRLGIAIGWSTQPDYHNLGSGQAPAQPLQLNPLAACGGSAVANGDGTYTATSPTPMPATAAGTAIVALEGHPALDADGDGAIDRIPVRNVHTYAAVTDATAQPRRQIVDIARCDECHGVLTLHGNNRTDDLQVCAACHNPNATDAARRVAGSQCVAELGADDAPIDFKYLIHAIHAGSIDVCGFGNTPIRFSGVRYPGRLDNCEGCHLPDTYYPVDAGAAGVPPTTFDAGADLAVYTDDRAVTPNAAVCSACHVDASARTHMELNGGSFVAAKTATGTLASGSVETCSVCHGRGAVADVKAAHQVGLFPGASDAAAQ